LIRHRWVALLLHEVTTLPSTPTATNFYSPLADSGSTFATNAAVRLANLKAHLQAAHGGRLALIGEAAGWRGARQSGVAFTAAPHLGQPGSQEATATTVRTSLQQAGLGEGVLLWNAFPLHPHQATADRTNRTPTRAELQSGAGALRLAIADRFVVCIGRSAAQAVSALLDTSVPPLADAIPTASAVAVRHPSFGGTSTFRGEFTEAVQRLSTF